jgi:hypothetical protein
MTQVGDLVLVYMEGSPAFFARIEDIAPDVKPEWFQLKMLVLQVPLLVITWILRDAYINGEEFTMGGRPMRLEKVVSPEGSSGETGPVEDFAGQEGEDAPWETPGDMKAPPAASSGGGKGKVVSLLDRKKKDPS